MTNDQRRELEDLIELYGLSVQVQTLNDHREMFREIARSGVDKAWKNIMDCINEIEK